MSLSGEWGTVLVLFKYQMLKGTDPAGTVVSSDLLENSADADAAAPTSA